MDHNKLELPLPLQEGNNNHEFLTQLAVTQIDVLTSTFSWAEADRSAAERATFLLFELAKNDELASMIVGCGAVPALVRHLQALPELGGAKPLEHEVETGSALALGLLAFKQPEHQQLIVEAGALPHLVNLLKRSNHDQCNSQTLNHLIIRTADAITNLAHENSSIKTLVRLEGGIPPLVESLESGSSEAQIAVAGALRTLAFKNDHNKNQIVECKALPILVRMLRSNDPNIHYEAVGVIGNLVHSSPNMKKEVLLAGALQPVIGLLSSCCPESQREAALLLGQFATVDLDHKVSRALSHPWLRPLHTMIHEFEKCLLSH